MALAHPQTLQHGTIFADNDDDVLNEMDGDCGFRDVFGTRPDGTRGLVSIPLTDYDFLHPKEGDHLPNSTFHDLTTADIRDILRRRYHDQPDVGVYSDLLIAWDIAIGNLCPDVFVAFGVKERERNRRIFRVKREGTRPALVIEVVSPRYRKTDRRDKVELYAQAGVQEYIIIDRRTHHENVTKEVIGYRLVGGFYRPIVPDTSGLVVCQTVSLGFGVDEQQVVIKDLVTGERLLSSLELAEAYAETAARAKDAETRAKDAEAENEALRAQLQALLAQQAK